MNIDEPVFVVILGFIIGIFSNIVIYIIPKNISISSALKFRNYENKIVFLKKHIKLSHIIIELISIILILMFYSKYGINMNLILYMIFIFLIITVSSIDIIYQDIHSIILITTGILGTMIQLIFLNRGIKDIIIALFVGFLIYFLIYFFSMNIYKEEVFGFGDVLYLMTLGVFFDYKKIIMISALSFWTSFIFIIIYMIFNRGIKKDTRIAFSQFISISAVITEFLFFRIINFYFTMI